MPTHARETILDQIVAQLQRIGDAGNAPSGKTWATSTIPYVTRRREIARNLAQFPAIKVLPESEEKERVASGGTTSMYNCVLTVRLDCWIRFMAAKGTFPDEEISKLLHDIELIMGDDFTLVSSAFDSEVVSNSVSESEEDEPLYGLQVDVDVTYRYFEADPSTIV